jgi:hypothetical protein
LNEVSKVPFGLILAILLTEDPLYKTKSPPACTLFTSMTLLDAIACNSVA